MDRYTFLFFYTTPNPSQRQGCLVVLPPGIRRRILMPHGTGSPRYGGSVSATRIAATSTSQVSGSVSRHAARAPRCCPALTRGRRGSPCLPTLAHHHSRPGPKMRPKEGLPASIRIRNRIGSSCLFRVSCERPAAPAKGPHTSPGTRGRTGMFPGVPHPRLERRGLPPAGSQHPNGYLHVVESNGHGISPSAEEASSPYGATDRGRPSCPNQASHGSIRYASATRVRSNAPGRCSSCLKQRPTRLREYPSCHPHATSGHAATQ